MYSFLWKPKWILSHVLIAALIVAMINLMFWQLRRLDEKKALNALIEARTEGDPRPLGDVLAKYGITAVADGDKAEFRQVVVSGTYDAAHEFTIPNRTLDGAPGRLVVTPLVWSESQPPILVERGFVPQAIDDDDPPIDGVEPPTGEVQVRGYLRQAELPGSFQGKAVALQDNRYARFDIDRLEAARHAEYQPVYLELAAQSPKTTSDVITPYPLPERDEGPHFSYAVQWAIFTLIAIGGYPLVLRRVARGKDVNRPDDVPTDGPGPDPDAELTPPVTA